MSVAAVVASTSLVLAGCGGGGSSSNQSAPKKALSQSAIAKAMNTPTKLTFWTWVPNIANEVKLFEKKYPKIDVNVVNVGQGADQYRKLRTVLKAGKGAPDVVQIEYQYLPSFVLGGNLLDLAPYGAAKIKSQYQSWVWSQVSRNGAVYGIPQDTGPMGLLYRKDLLQKAGVKPPATWADFAAASTAYHQKNPKGYLTDLPGNDAGQFIGLLWQNGARPFSYDGKQTVSINLDSPQVTKVSDYWTKLIGTGSVATDSDFTDQWYQGLANGTYASWLTAAWGPVFLQGTAKKTSGLWRATQLPQYPGGQVASGNWGGSTDAVVKGTQHEIAAAQLALWVNTDHTSAMQLATKQFLFPASQKVLQDSSWLDQKSPFYGGQQVNKTFAQINKTVNKNFGWLPFQDYVYSSFNDTVGKAIADKGDVTAAVKTWQGKLVSYAKQQGFTVK
jgi:multiple sugar transport system substrate-binding protein